MFIYLGLKSLYNITLGKCQCIDYLPKTIPSPFIRPYARGIGNLSYVTIRQSVEKAGRKIQELFKAMVCDLNNHISSMAAQIVIGSNLFL